MIEVEKITDPLGKTWRKFQQVFVETGRDGRIRGTIIKLEEQGAVSKQFMGVVSYPRVTVEILGDGHHLEAFLPQLHSIKRGENW